MSFSRRDVLLTNIENSAVFISANYGSEYVADVMRKHGVKSFEELSAQECEEVFGDLFQYEVDAKS